MHFKMKLLLILAVVTTFLLSNSVDARPQPHSLVVDLQRGSQATGRVSDEHVENCNDGKSYNNAGFSLSL